jgi:hypothetical protein
VNAIFGLAFLLLAAVVPSATAGETSAPAEWDTLSDTWTATDALGRTLPDHGEVGPPRADRQVGIFYFLWLGPHAGGRGPFDITKILAADPKAMQERDSPLWGPLHAPHHWGESLFGYYESDDPWVLRKHARMLGNAGIDAVIFDVTNQVTYEKNYQALLREFAAVRAEGGRPPRVAFLCPFGDPPRVVDALFRDLYEPGIHPELWFPWDGKPLILADPERLAQVEERHLQERPDRLEAGGSLGQSFTADRPFEAAGGCFPTWRSKNSAATLTLRKDGPGGERVASRRLQDIQDNGWLLVKPERPLPAGAYYLEISEPEGTVGWWSGGDGIPGGTAFAGGAPVAGDRSLRIAFGDERTARIREFFTFRKPQPDYFKGPTGPDMWSWLEVHPQHVFRNSRGEKEQMSVGVAQNAVGGRLGSMSEPGARGRSFHGGAMDPRPDAVLRGLNLAEQFERALREDPRFIFITGWNEWIAGRFDEFGGVRMPVMFVDQFDQEHSRDIEPMRGGHGDNYYWQMVAAVRRYKGVRPLPPPGPPRTIHLHGGPGQWDGVAPEYRDAIGDTFHRDHRGYNGYRQLADRSGRNDIVALHVARDEKSVYFHARCRDPIAPPGGASWMWLLIDIDRDHRTGWEGFDFIANRTLRGSASTALERSAGGWKWEATADVPFALEGKDLWLALPRAALGVEPERGPLRFDFQWADGIPPSGDILDFWTHGDAAPDGRFEYRFDESVKSSRGPGAR